LLFLRYKKNKRNAFSIFLKNLILKKTKNLLKVKLKNEIQRTKVQQTNT